ncbi:MAG: methyltransferase family protein [Candidatus Eiseniibacteriota bacterium]
MSNQHVISPGGPRNIPMFISLGLWLVLGIYWEVAARSASAPKSSESGASRAFHVLMANGAVIISFWPFTGWPNATWSYFEFPRVLPALGWQPPLGLAISAVCLLLALWARHALGRNWSGAVTVKRDHQLVHSGPYRWIRHPIYAGAIGMHIGTALISGRLQGPLAIVLIVLAYVRKTRMEERVLGEVFGDSYAEYKRESWALVPWVF